MAKQIDQKYKDLLLPYEKLRALKEAPATLPPFYCDACGGDCETLLAAMKKAVNRA